MNALLAGEFKYNGMPVVLIIDKSCKELIKDLWKVQLGIDGKLKVRVNDKQTGLSWEELGHTSDALDYLIVKLFYDDFTSKD